ncbi:MAG: hypothetical protein QOD44_1271 [Solirubrobacteraceae bacterium]|nr:hypothetical protein [Solirubrobacteraceae bacterium]
MWGGASQPIIDDMLMTGSAPIDAERAFSRAVRARRRAALLRRLRGQAAVDARLAVYDDRASSATADLRTGIREIPLDAISGTLEPSRASLFDRRFLPAAGARSRWERVWIAEQRGAVLPPIAVVRSGDGYLVRDGHHRVSVARARGACTIDAVVGAAQAA